MHFHPIKLRHRAVKSTRDLIDENALPVPSAPHIAALPNIQNFTISTIFCPKKRRKWLLDSAAAPVACAIFFLRRRLWEDSGRDGESFHCLGQDWDKNHISTGKPNLAHCFNLEHKLQSEINYIVVKMDLIFFVTFSRGRFLVNKGVYFFRIANNLNFENVPNVYIYLPLYLASSLMIMH